jgi:hypothetical protein
VSLSAILVGAGVSTARVARANQAATDGREWATRLKDPTCDDACIGGSACLATGNKACPSKFTCILGNREDNLDMDMPLYLYVAALVSQDSAVNTCNSDLVVCLTPFSTQTTTCVPISDPCQHEGRSTVAIPVATRDLVFDGVGVAIRQGSSKGPELATSTIRYGTPLRKIGLCSGFRFGGLSNAPGRSLKYVTFFVEPRQ